MRGAPAGLLIVVLVIVAVPSLLAYFDLRRLGQGNKVWFIVLAFVFCWPAAFVLWVFWHARGSRPSELPSASR